MHKKPGGILAKTAVVYKLETGEKGFASTGNLGRLPSLILDQFGDKGDFCLFLTLTGSPENIQKELSKEIVKKY